MDFDDADQNNPGDVAMAAWQFFNLQPPEWQFSLQENVRVVQFKGPGQLFQYWELGQAFHKSMSGGAIMQADRVMGVISNVAMENGKPVGEGNYAAMLRFATDIGWQRATKCGPSIANPQELRPYPSRELFIADTCEGDIAAWLPDGAGGKFWNFPVEGNYSLRTKDLPCAAMCKCAGARAEKIVRLLINHRVSTRSSSRTCQEDARPLGPSASGAQTFYGIQVVPVFTSASQDTRVAEANTWLFRTGLYRRDLKGSFAASGRYKDTIWLKPSSYNGAVHASEKISSAQLAKCGTQLSPAECKDILGVMAFEETVRGKWHGFSRNNRGAKSTLFGPELKETWLVPDHWLQQDIEVKNWILRYTPTTQVKSTQQVTLAFCVNSDWAGFYLKAFSPERGIRTNPIHVYFQE